jgi:cation transport ATPase
MILMSGELKDILRGVELSLSPIFAAKAMGLSSVTVETNALRLRRARFGSF